MAKFGVIGTGLIGGSIAKALPADAIVWDADSKSLDLAKEQGIEVAGSIGELVRLVDLAVIGVPFNAFDAVFAEAQAAAADREKPIVVTNVLSVMNPVEVTEPNVQFVAGHPMAGTEFSGFSAAKADLFAGATWVLERAGFAELEALIERLGAKVVHLPTELHNKIVGKVSHLPHVLAAAQVLAMPENPDFYSLAASSFRDSTRVAASAPELTSAMINNNRAEVLHSINELRGVLDEFAELIEAGDDEGVKALFARANKLREQNL